MFMVFFWSTLITNLIVTLVTFESTAHFMYHSVKVVFTLNLVLTIADLGLSMSWVLYREVVVPQAVIADQLRSHNFILVLSAMCAYHIHWYFSNVIDADQPRHISHLSARFKSLIGQSPGPHITAVRNAAAFVSLVGPLNFLSWSRSRSRSRPLKSKFSHIYSLSFTLPEHPSVLSSVDQPVHNSWAQRYELLLQGDQLCCG